MTRKTTLLLAGLVWYCGCGAITQNAGIAISGSGTPAPGVVLFSATNGSPQAFATDLNGNIVRTFAFDNFSGSYSPSPIKLLKNGDMLMIEAFGDGIAPCADCGQNNFMEEMTQDGAPVWKLTNAELQAELTAAGFGITIGQMSHDAVALPNGHIVVLASDLRPINGANVEGGAVVDLDANHEPVWVWDAFDHLDLNRHPYFAMPDWIHGNGLRYSPDDGNLIYSSRAQSWLMKLDYENGQGTGDVLWRLGYQGDFQLAGGGAADWFYGQHSPVVLSPNSTGVIELGVFDNGDSRVLDAAGDQCGNAGQAACYSTVPILQVDENQRTATILWRDTLSLYSPALGTMQVLSNGDVWFLAGTVNGKMQAIVREVTMTETPQTVFEMDLDQSVYRAVHLDALP